MQQVLSFEKLQGAGNDFVFIEDMNDEITLSPEQVQTLCDRHFGIGGDGVILVKPPKDSTNDGFMDYINSDGTLAQMCGNGVRCFAKYLVDHKLVDTNKTTINVETRAGVKPITYTCDNDGKLVTATVNMGAPILTPADVPTTLEANASTESGEPFVKNTAIESPYGSFEFTCVSMGNPHAVTFVDDCNAIDIDTIGAFYESCDAFPEKANIEFATIEDNGSIRMRVYERGCGETLACGTGACATNVAAFLTGRASRKNDIVLLGGTLQINFTPEGFVYMTGPARTVFTGEVTI